MNQGAFMTGMGRISEFIRRFTGTNLLWFLFNLPTVFLSILLLTTKNFAQINAIIILIVFTLPFVFFPATMAMFGVLRKFVLGKDVSILRSYFKYYKNNYVRSMAGGFVFILLWFILGYYYIMFGQASKVSLTLIGVIGLILFMFNLNFFALTVHLKTKLHVGLKNAFLITVSGHFLTLGVGLVSVIILYISFNVFTFFIPFFTGSLIAYLTFFVFNRLVIDIQEKGITKSR